MAMLAMFVLLLQLVTSKSTSKSTQEAMATSLIAAVVTSSTTSQRTHQSTITLGLSIWIGWAHGLGIVVVGWVWVLVICALLRELLRWRRSRI